MHFEGYVINREACPKSRWGAQAIFHKAKSEYAIDFHAVRGFMPSHAHQDLMDSQEGEKRDKYEGLCKASFMLFVMDGMGRMGPSAIENHGPVLS